MPGEEAPHAEQCLRCRIHRVEAVAAVRVHVDEAGNHPQAGSVNDPVKVTGRPARCDRDDAPVFRHQSVIGQQHGRSQQFAARNKRAHDRFFSHHPARRIGRFTSPIPS